MVRDQHFTDSQLGRSEIGVVRTREVQVHERITTIDQRERVGHIFDPRGTSHIRLQRGEVNFPQEMRNMKSQRTW
jgi:hypothetical protein